jgi:stage II sporulation protein R
MKKWIRALALALVLSLLVSLGGFGAECAAIRERVLRLHVLANSDSDEDQALKLKVRDAIVQDAAGLFDDCTDRVSAHAAAEAQLARLQETAEACVQAEGYDYAVRVELCEMYFTTRQYETVTLPAGRYDALRVTIGEGAGHNWWCVVFPPMCVSAASEHTELSEVLDDRQLDIVEHPQQYEVRFKIVEWFEAARDMVSGWFGE